MSASTVIDELFDWWPASDLVGKMRKPELADQHGVVELISIAVYAEHHGKKYARKAFEKLIGLADEHGVTIMLTVRPIGDFFEDCRPVVPFEKPALIGWYRRHGFEIDLAPSDDDLTVMHRQPRRR